MNVDQETGGANGGKTNMTRFGTKRVRQDPRFARTLLNVSHFCTVRGVWRPTETLNGRTSSGLVPNIWKSPMMAGILIAHGRT